MQDPAKPNPQISNPWDIRMPWTPFTSASDIAGSTGVYEIADSEGHTLYLGAASAKDLFGLRGRIAAHFKEPNASRYRYEVTTAYLSRWMELLGRHKEQNGEPPPLNRDEDIPTLPRFIRSTSAAR